MAGLGAGASVILVSFIEHPGIPDHVVLLLVLHLRSPQAIIVSSISDNVIR
jgi:hypothetical protein